MKCISHPDVVNHINELYEVKWDDDAIELNQNNDVLTPFLIIEYLSILKAIVRKGLKKSYYKVEQNLTSRVKGKILISKTVKLNHLHNRKLNTYCSFDEFGLNNKENRLLKKALTFVRSYLSKHSKFKDEYPMQDIFNYINPAFTEVSDSIELNDIKHTKTNSFYKEYAQGISLAKKIIRRFGYNISNTKNDNVKTTPHWIDMSKLFELYTLSLLKDRFKNTKEVEYSYNVGKGNELDFLLNSDNYKMVIDTKYKPGWSQNVNHDDVRQVAGYARLSKVYKELGKERDEVIDCLIIYPDQENGHDNFEGLDFTEEEQMVNGYYDIYTVAIKLPQTHHQYTTK